MLGKKEILALQKEVAELKQENKDLRSRIELTEQVQNNMGNDFLIILQKFNKLEEEKKPKYFA